MSIYHDILQKYWGYAEFRELQEDIILSVCEGRDTLALMPTGGGKSITFQVPALAMEGICLVVTPLIALMKDQVENLKSRNIKASAIYSGMSQKEIIITIPKRAKTFFTSEVSIPYLKIANSTSQRSIIRLFHAYWVKFPLA